jgi:hypothetical protein
MVCTLTLLAYHANDDFLELSIHLCGPIIQLVRLGRNLRLSLALSNANLLVGANEDPHQLSQTRTQKVLIQHMLLW